MIKPIILGAASALFLLSASAVNAHNHGGDHSAKAAIEKAVNNTSVRSELDMERDQYRNPVETLSFFGLEPGMTVAELGPSSGWYTRILAPVTAEKGKYIALNGSPNPESERYSGQMQWRETFIDRDSGLFGKHALDTLDKPYHLLRLTA